MESRAPRTSSRSRTARRPAGGGDLDRLLKRQPWDSLIPHLLKAAMDPDAAIARLQRYAKVLIEWNRKVSNIISRNDEERIVQRHIAESIEPAAWLRESGAARWLDFGSGAGLPAIPLMIAGVGERWTLVESRRVKTLFLTKAIETLELSGVEIVQARLEVLVEAADRRGAYQGFTSRATQTLGPTLALAEDLVAPEGRAFLWKGTQREQEMASDPGWQRAWELDGLLGIGAGQTAVARFTRKA
jgi:16S rRNA (guanine527-N7)-methyltransferase